MNTCEYRTVESGKGFALFTFVVVAYLACFLWIGNYGAFWSEDAGVKYLQTVNLIRSHWTDSSLLYPGEAFDPGFEFNPLFGAATYINNGRIYTPFPVSFASISALFYRALGFPGLYLLPLLSTVVLLMLVRKLSMLFLDCHDASSATLIAAFASPLMFYAFTFWELNVAGCVMCAGLLIFLKAERASSPGRIVLGGSIMGMSIFFREESILFLLALVIVRFVVSRDVRVGLLLVASSVVPVAGFLALEYVTSGRIMAHFFRSIEIHSREFGSPGAILEHKWNLISELILRAHPNIWVSVALVTPVILFIVTWTVVWKTRGVSQEPEYCAGLSKNREILLLSLLSLVLVSHVCYLGLLYTSEFPIRLSMVTNGLLVFSPWVVFGLCQPGRRVGVHADIFLIALLFMIFLCLVVPTSGGLQWGPRYLVVIYSLLSILSLASFSSWRRIAAYRKWLTFLFCAFIVLGCVNEIFGLVLLKSKKDFNARALACLRAAPPKTVISIPWWAPLSMAPAFYEKEFFLALNPQILDRLVGRLRDKQRKGFVLITGYDQSIRDAIAARYNLMPVKVDSVRNRWDKFFQINLLEYRLNTEGDESGLLPQNNK